jgi:hypothetical protein
MKYRRKSIEVEAVQYTGDMRVVEAFAGTNAIWDGGLFIETPGGYVSALLNDWIIKEGNRFSVCLSDVFPNLYEPVDEG